MKKTAPNALQPKPWRQILGVLNSQHLRQPSTLGDPLKPAQGKKAETQIPNQRHRACFSTAILLNSKKQQQFKDRHWSAKRAWKDSRNKLGNSEGGGIASFGRVDTLEERRLEKAALPSSWHNEAGTRSLRRVFLNRLACKCPVMIAPSMPHSHPSLRHYRQPVTASRRAKCAKKKPSPPSSGSKRSSLTKRQSGQRFKNASIRP